MNSEEIKKDPQRITKIEPFVNKYKEKEKTFSQKKMIGENLRRNNAKTALNILYAKKGKIYPAYIWKHNSNREKRVILIMIPNRQKLWHYLTVKTISIFKRNNF